jgi:pimeloyl-ACP methyl ester carboxylesterase
MTPIVFLHGAFCGGWSFAEFREPFEAAGYETHAPNLPHHERGADLEALAEMGVADFAETMLHYVEELKAPPILIGHSLGGLIAQLIAAQTKCAALVLVAPSAPWGVPATTLEETGNAFGVAMLGDYWRRPISPDYRVARQTTLDRLSRDDARRAFARFSPESGRAIMEVVHWWADSSMAAAAPVYKIEAPVLAIAGGADRVNASSTVRRVAARFPEGQAHFHEFPGMSHWLIGEPEWREVAQLAIDWLAARMLAPERKKRGLFGLFRANREIANSE